MKKVVLCADDYGQNQSISQAIIALLEKNRLSATSCMTNSSGWLEHARWLQPFDGQADIGLHFNLTEGKPLSERLAATHGIMSLQHLIAKACAHRLSRSAVEAELNAQLDAFVEGMGRLPDFVDGHQHIHQLPVIRHALLNVYEARLRDARAWLRCVHDPRAFLRVHSRHYLKKLIIQLLGAGVFKKMVIERGIPHNSSFAGIYSFTDAMRYSHMFPRFLADIRDNGLIMCHPGLLTSDRTDKISDARYQEFLYLIGDHVVRDCLHAGVSLHRLVK